MLAPEEHETVPSHLPSEQNVTTKDVLPRNPIKRLEKDVADRIAAGEVILRPASVVKELLENSIDAHATQIEVSLLDGGLKTIKFRDNGDGIHPDDLMLLCERFATSKLTKYEDLLSLGTFGFRGEALASISFVSHLTVITMREKSDFAYQAYFENGQLVPSEKLGTANPKKCSGVKGTTFIVEDLFYNCPLRKKSLNSSKEEYRFIIDLLMKYSVRYPSVSFSCRRLENTKFDFFTPCVESELSSVGNVYGKEVTEELIEVASSTTSWSLHGYVTNANFSLRRSQFIFFVNGRLIEWQSLKKAISSLYSSLLPKGGYPFIYIDVVIDPRLIDVNVHPAKRQIYFMDEDNIVQTLLRSIEAKLKISVSSRHFQTVSLRDTSFRENIESFESYLEKRVGNSQNIPEREFDQAASETRSSIQTGISQRPSKESRPYKKIRTSICHSSRTLDSFLSTPSSYCTDRASEETFVRQDVSSPTSSCLHISSTESDRFPFHDIELEAAVDPELCDGWSKEAISVFATQRLKLFERDCHDGIKKMLNEACFVGSIDEDHILIQYQTKLFWINLTSLLKRMFFQKCIKTIQNFSSVPFTSKIPVYRSVLLYLDNFGEKLELRRESHQEIGKEICNVLSKYRNLLQEYFAIHFEGFLLSNFCLTAIPQLNEGVSLQQLGKFLFQLGGETRWHDLKFFLEDVCTALACLFSYKFSGLKDKVEDTSSTVVMEDGDNSRWQQALLESLRHSWEPPKECATNDDVIEITSLERLYRVFERC